MSFVYSVPVTKPKLMGSNITPFDFQNYLLFIATDSKYIFS